jgi:hypothetical protein
MGKHAKVSEPTVQELVENEIGPIRQKDVTELLRNGREVVRRLERIEDWFLGER